MALQDLKHWFLDRVGTGAPPAVAVLRLEGVIGMRGGRGLTLPRLAGLIERAFKLPNLKAVALSINSPGGAPVQSSLIYQRIRALSAEKKIPVFAFAEDIAASGGYWLLLAGDEIYADSASLLGSIGVVSSGFGFPEVLRRFGVERRLHTAGRDKSLLDPFRAEDPRDVARLERLQRELHETFKDVVRERRGAKLSTDIPELFEGEVFSGRRAVELGLADGLGDLRGVMRARFGEDVRLRLVTPPRSWRRWRVPGTSAFRPDLAEIVGEIWSAIEERLHWGRFGL
jgi:serine protease SohB